MPRIRKKTSRRGTTNQREKIKHKVSETRKKRKKDEKKNTQWKSKLKKDPGIPSNFPYKDQILAEVSEQRRKVEEEKQKRKEDRKLAKETTISSGAQDLSESDQKAPQNTKHFDATSPSQNHPEQVVPALINHELPNLRAVLDVAHIVIQVLDARDPLSYRNTHLEELVKAKPNQKLAFVLNKIDLCPREAVESWVAHLRRDIPCIPFCPSSTFLPSADAFFSNKGKRRIEDDSIGRDNLLDMLQGLALELKEAGPIVVAVVGVANVGKSALLDSLVQKEAFRIYTHSSTSHNTPTTTTHAQEVILDLSGVQYRLIDTPGIVLLPESDATDEGPDVVRSRDILLRNRGRIDRLKAPIPVVTELVTRANREDLILFYNIPVFTAGDALAFLVAVARANSLLKKGGKPDLTGAARLVLRDWGTGKFPRYTQTPRVPGFAFLASDGRVFSALKSRSELRKTSGLVKLNSSKADYRRIDVETSWDHDQASTSSDTGSNEETQSIPIEQGDSDDTEESEDDEEEAELKSDSDQIEDEAPASGKRKRNASSTHLTPRPKKVSFARDPKSTPAKVGRGAAAKTPSKSRTNSSNPRTLAKAANASNAKVTSVEEGEAPYDFGKFF